MPASRRGRRGRPLLATAVACLLTLSAVPAHAGEPLPPVEADASLIGKATNDPTSDTGRFVTLWDSRFRSGEAFQAYLDSDQEYDDGYNDRGPEEQARLVRALVDHWRATDPGFAERVDWAPRAPEDETRDGDRVTHTQVLSLVNSIVFHKEEFKKAMRGPSDETSGSVEAPTGGAATPSEPTPADPLAEAATTALSGVVERAREMTGTRILDQQAEQVLAPAAGQVRDAVPPDVVDRVPTTGDVVGVDLGEIGQTLDRVGVALPEVERPRDVKVPASFAAAALEPADLLYGVCWSVGTGAQTCTGKTYVVGVLTQLPGVAAEINVDNNLLTGLGGADLEIGLVIDPLAAPGGMGTTVTVRTHGIAARYARGVVHYTLPGSDKDVFVGFDGRTVTLQPQQSVGAVFENVVAMSSGDTRITANVAHTGAPGVPTVKLVTDVSSATSSDTLAATTSFVRAPATHTTRLVMKRAGQTSIVRVESSHTGSVLPDLHVDAAIRAGTARVVGTVRLTEVPGSKTIVDATSDASTRTSTVVYDANAQLKRLQAGVVFTGDVAAPGTNVTGSLDVHRLPSDITLVLNDTDVTYTASAGITATTGNALEAAVEERVSNVVRRKAFLGTTSAPSTVRVTRTAGAPSFVLDSGSGIARVQAAYYDASLLLDASLTIEGFPGRAELRMPSSADSKVSWLSSAPTQKVQAQARYGAWYGGFTVTSVPTSISIVPRTDEIDVNAAGGTPATVTAYITNTGSYVVSPTAGDNYATATYRKTLFGWSPWFGSGSASTAQITAALHVQGIQRIRVKPGPSTALELRLGGGAPLYVMGRFEEGFSRKYAEARLVNFPGVVTGTIGATTEIWSSANADLRAYVESGPTGTYPAMASPHGVVFHRQATSLGPQHRGTLWLTGLPTYVKVAPGQITLNGLRPTQPTLTVEVRLLDVAAAPTEAYAWLTGIPVNVTHNVTFRWSTERVGGVVTTKFEGTTSGASFGALSVYLRHAQYAATLDTSALPSSMKVTMTESEGSTTVKWDASAVIASVSAGLLARPDASSPFSGRGSVVLSNIPSSFTLTTGRGASGTGPVLAYDSNGSAALSATVVADGSLKTSSGALQANLFFRLTSLAQKVDVVPLGSGFRLTGTGRTSRVEARVSASASFTKTGSGNVYVRSWVRLPWEYSLTLSPVVKNLSVDVTNVAGFEVEPGLVSRLAGDYGTFRFAYDSFLVNVNARGRLRAQFDIVGTWTFDIWNASYAATWNINPTFRVYDDAWVQFFDRRFHPPCYEMHVKASVRPRLIAQTNLVSGINLTGSPGSWRSNWATPVLFGWWWLSDIVTGFTLPGGPLSVYFDDDWTCW